MEKRAYIKEIKIEKYKALERENIEIDSSFNHIAIAGTSGSGKTTLLEGIWQWLKVFIDGEYENISRLEKDLWTCKTQLSFLRNEEILTEYSKEEIFKLKEQEKYLKRKGEKYCSQVALKFVNDENLQKKFIEKEFLLVFYKTRRELIIEENLEKDYEINKFYRLFREIIDIKEEALYTGDDEEIIQINRWYRMLERIIKIILNKQGAHIIVSKEGILIKEKGRSAYKLEELSDGQKSILQIFLELIGMMGDSLNRKCDKEGIVLIDGIDTYLDREIAEKVISILYKQFPNIQFIISAKDNSIFKKVGNLKVYNLGKNN